MTRGMEATADDVLDVDVGHELAGKSVDEGTRSTSQVSWSSNHNGLSLQWIKGWPLIPNLNRSKSIAIRAKRVIDLTLSFIALVLLLPVLVLAAAAVKATSKGPVFFVQKREGLNGKIFDIYKFRSLYWDQSDHSGNKIVREDDNRLTPIGGFLRRTSLDELPQILNIIKGDMSIVGPRPHVPGMEVNGVPYEETVPYYHLRHSIKPGLTGWAQAHDLRGAVEKAEAARARVDHDLAYIQNLSLSLDAKIIARTAIKEAKKLVRYK